MPNPSRLEEVHGLVKSNPGITMLEIAERLNINYRTVTRHLKTLVSEDRVDYDLRNRKRHYFAIATLVSTKPVYKMQIKLP